MAISHMLLKIRPTKIISFHLIARDERKSSYLSWTTKPTTTGSGKRTSPAPVSMLTIFVIEDKNRAVKKCKKLKVVAVRVWCVEDWTREKVCFLSDMAHKKN